MTTCCICHGAAHPSTGAQYTERSVACYSCVMRLWQWFFARHNGRPRRRPDGSRGPNFYDHVNQVHNG